MGSRHPLSQTRKQSRRAVAGVTWPGLGSRGELGCAPPKLVFALSGPQLACRWEGRGPVGQGPGWPRSVLLQPPGASAVPGHRRGPQPRWTEWSWGPFSKLAPNGP